METQQLNACNTQVNDFTLVLDAIYQRTSDAILIADDNNNYIQVNPAAARMLGYTIAELVGMNVNSIIHNVIADKPVIEPWDDFIVEGQQSGIVELKKKNGDIITCHYNASANILPGLHLSILTNITSRERIKKEALEKSKQVESILERITDCFFSVDKNWTVNYWNKAAEVVLNKNRDEIIGKNLWEVYPEAIDLKIYKEYNRALQNQVTVHFTDYYPQLQQWFEITAYPSKEGLAVYFRDITASKKFTKELLQTKNNYEAILNATADKVWSVSKDMKLLAANCAYKKKIFDLIKTYPVEGEDVLMPAFGTEECQRWKALYTEALNGKTIHEEQELLLPGSNKPEFSELLINPIYDVISSEVIAIACSSRDITERKEAEKLIQLQNKKLQESGRYVETLFRDLKKIMDSSLDVICSTDKEGRFLQVSAASASVWGYQPAELLGRRYLELVYQDDREKTMKMAEKVIGGSKVFDFENRFIKKEGSIIHLIWSATWDEQQRTMFSVAKDATSMKAAEKEKKDSEMRFTALVENIGDVITVLNKDLVVTYETPSFSRITAHKQGTRIGKSTLDFVHPKDQNKVKAAYASLSPGQVISCVYRCRNAKGNYLWMEATISNQLDNPIVQGYVVNKRDITRSKKASLLIQEQNNELKARELLLTITSRRLKKIMNSSLDVICSFDADGRFIQASEACRSVWGYTAEELVGKPYLNFVHPDYIQKTITASQDIMSGIDTTDFENVYIHKSGAEVPILWSATWDEEEEVMYAIAKDATQLKKADKVKSETERKYSMLLSKGSDAISILDEKGVYTFVSPNVERTFGFTAEQLVGKVHLITFTKMICLQHTKSLMRYCRMRIRHPSPSGLKMHLVHGDG